MANNTSNSSVDYFILLDITYKNNLASIRKWNSLKIAFDAQNIWIKGLDYAHIQSVEIKSIPYITVFYELNGKLFLINSLLPDRTVPSLLWTPIERALPIELPSFNHNYFGLQEKIDIKIIPSFEEQKALAMLVNLQDLKTYLETASDIRTKNLRWTVLDTSFAFILGTPLLPLNGEVFWNTGLNFIPVGYNFELSILATEISKTILKEEKKLLIWNTKSAYFILETHQLQALSLSSLRLTLALINKK